MDDGRLALRTKKVDTPRQISQTRAVGGTLALWSSEISVILLSKEQGHWAFWPPVPISKWQVAAGEKGGRGFPAPGLLQVCCCSWRKPQAPGPGAAPGRRLASTGTERTERYR